MEIVEVRKTEDRGLGVFAVRAIGQGERIRGAKIEREITESKSLGPGDTPDHAFQSDGRLLLVGEPDRYLNHSCDPNAYVWYKGTAIDLIARRRIKAEEEITVDYLINNEGGDRWECGSEGCRGDTAASFFELPFTIQHEYYPLLAPWFLKKHTRRLVPQNQYYG